MRKMMTKEVTVTTLKVAKMEVKDGVPVAVELPTETMLGNVSMERAQKMLNKKYNTPVTVFELKTDSLIYEMEVEEFIKHAKLRTNDVVEVAKEELTKEPKPSAPKRTHTKTEK